MIDENATGIIAGQYNMNRWPRYKGAVDWKLHSVYFKHEIYRGYWKHNGKATSLYASMDGGNLLLGGSLDCIRGLIKEVKE